MFSHTGGNRSGNIPAGSPESVAIRSLYVYPMPLSCHGHCTPVSKFHLSNPLNHGPSTRGLLFPATTLIMLAREEKALWNDAVREHAPALRGHLGNAWGRTIQIEHQIEESNCLIKISVSFFSFILVQSSYNDGHLTWAKFCKVQMGKG